MASNIDKTASNSTAMVIFNPKRVEASHVDRVTILFQSTCKSALESEKYAARHLKQYGEGQIFILLGTSTAGKTSIMHQLMKEIPDSIGTSMDKYGPAHDADLIRKHVPQLYAKMLLAMEHSDIAYAVFAGQGDAVRWKENVSEETLRDAKEALKQARQMIDSFPRVPFPVVESRMMDHIIGESTNGKTVIFDIFDSNLFLERMIQRNFYAPLKRGLVYCPFHVLAERVTLRNAKALGEGGNPEDWRPPIQPLMEFIQFYKPAEDGDTAIDTLHRELIDSAFESAFKQEIGYWFERASIDPLAAKRYDMLTADHDKMKREVMTSLGFSHSDIVKVKITPKFKGFDYLFNTHVMKPQETTAN